jgi:hypothetical protein
LAAETGNVPEPPEDASTFIEYVEGRETEEATYEEVRQIVNERVLEGWKLWGMVKAPRRRRRRAAVGRVRRSAPARVTRKRGS